MAEGSVRVCETTELSCFTTPDYTYTNVTMICIWFIYRSLDAAPSDFFVQQMMKPHLLHTFYLTFNVPPAYRIYTRYLLSAVNQALESQPECCPLVCIQVRSGTKHLHTVGLSPVPFYSSAAPSEDSPTGKCKYTRKTHVCKCSNLLCEKKIRHAHFFFEQM